MTSPSSSRLLLEPNRECRRRHDEGSHPQSDESPVVWDLLPMPAR